MAERARPADTQTAIVVVLEVLKLQVAALQGEQAHTSKGLEEVYGKVQDGLNQRVALMEQRLNAVSKVGAWLVSFVTALLVAFSVYAVSQMWSTRDTVQRLQKEHPNLAPPPHPSVYPPLP